MKTHRYRRAGRDQSGVPPCTCEGLQGRAHLCGVPPERQPAESVVLETAIGETFRAERAAWETWRGKLALMALLEEQLIQAKAREA